MICPGLEVALLKQFGALSLEYLEPLRMTKVGAPKVALESSDPLAWLL